MLLPIHAPQLSFQVKQAWRADASAFRSRKLTSEQLLPSRRKDCYRVYIRTERTKRAYQF